VAAAAALAAGLAIGALVTHKRVEPRAAVDLPPVATSPTVAAPQPERAAPVAAARATPVRRSVPRRATRPVAVDDRFLALDDEPFDTGVVWRVALGPAQVPADVILGPDGRARAVRLVNYKER